MKMIALLIIIFPLIGCQIHPCHDGEKENAFQAAANLSDGDFDRQLRRKEAKLEELKKKLSLQGAAAGAIGGAVTGGVISDINIPIAISKNVPKKRKYNVIQLFYATDRNRKKTTDTTKLYGSKRGDAISYGEVFVIHLNIK